MPENVTPGDVTPGDVTPGDVTPGDKERANMLSVTRWLLLVAISFGLLALGLSWISRSVIIASPMSESAPASESASASESESMPEADGDYPLPDFRFASLDGETIGPRDYPDDVIIVELWATWCVPCRLQAKYLEELYRDLKGKGVHFLAVSIGEDEATVREYVEQRPFPYPVLLDPEDSIGQRYDIYGLPTVMIINRQGVVSFLETGVSDATRLRRALRIAGADVT